MPSMKQALKKIKREASAAEGGTKARRATKKKKGSKKFRKGYSRTSGYYGRFGGDSGEDKFFDTSLNFTVDTTGEVPATGQLALIPQGVTESTRVGRKCVLTSISIHAFLQFVPAAAATAATIVALYLMQDTQTNGAAAAATDVFNSTDFVSGHRNLSNSQRFLILKKWLVTMVAPSGVTTAYNNVIRPWHYYRRCKIPMEYSSTTGALTEIRTNNIFLMASALSSDDTVTINGQCRVRFSDN